MRWVRHLVVLVCVGLAGCIRMPTDAQRTASFEPYRTLTLAGNPMEQGIAARMAVLISSDDMEPVDPAGGGDEMRWQLKPNQRQLNLSRGMATAIDTRGYFLTAGHCVNGKKKLTIAFSSNGGTHAAVPRIVARFSDLDVAIIAVSTPLSATFEWAPAEAVKPGAVLLVGGAKDLAFEGHASEQDRSLKAPSQPVSVTEVLQFKRQTLAGVLKESVPQTGGWTIKHTAPIRPGDSGGPTVNDKGQLVGINTGIEFVPFVESTEISCRPDPAEVARLIDKDYAMHQAK